jgi:hypothetical protein
MTSTKVGIYPSHHLSRLGLDEFAPGQKNTISSEIPSELLSYLFSILNEMNSSSSLPLQDMWLPIATKIVKQHFIDSANSLHQHFDDAIFENASPFFKKQLGIFTSAVKDWNCETFEQFTLTIPYLKETLVTNLTHLNIGSLKKYLLHSSNAQNNIYLRDAYLSKQTFASLNKQHALRVRTSYAAQKSLVFSLDVQGKRQVAFNRCLDRERNFLHRWYKQGGHDLESFNGSLQISLIASSLEKMSASVGQMFTDEEKEMLKKVSEKLTRCSKTGLEIGWGSHFPENFLSILKEQAHTVGGAVLTNSGAHALLFLLQQAENSTYALSILNSGEGILYHHRHPTNYMKFQTNATWSHLSEEQISEFDFYKLVTIEKTEEVYTFVKNSLGKPQDPISSNPHSFHKYQLHGTCSEQVIHVFLHSAFPDPLYHKIKLALTDESIEALEEIPVHTPLDKFLLKHLQKVRVRRQEKIIFGSIQTDILTKIENTYGYRLKSQIIHASKSLFPKQLSCLIKKISSSNTTSTHIRRQLIKYEHENKLDAIESGLSKLVRDKYLLEYDAFEKLAIHSTLIKETDHQAFIQFLKNPFTTKEDLAHFLNKICFSTK